MMLSFTDWDYCLINKPIIRMEQTTTTAIAAAQPPPPPVCTVPTTPAVTIMSNLQATRRPQRRHAAAN